MSSHPLADLLHSKENDAMPSSSRFGSDSDIPYGQQNEGIDSESAKCESGSETERDAFEELEEAFRTQTILDRQMDEHSDRSLQTEVSFVSKEDNDRVSRNEDLSPSRIRNLTQQLAEREAEIEQLKESFSAHCWTERKLLERVHQLESIITISESAAAERILLKNEVASLRSRINSQTPSKVSPSDPIVAEKLNLAYADLSAIYDIRLDIDRQLNVLQHGILDPTLRKQIIKRVRDMELHLRQQHRLKEHKGQ